MKRLVYKAREWARQAASRLFLMRVADWYDAKHSDVCRADIITELGFGYDLGKVISEGIGTYRGGANRCKREADDFGSCWCGKQCKRTEGE